MLCSLLAAIALEGERIVLPTADGAERLSYARVALGSAKMCPKYGWEFPFCWQGSSRTALKFNVYVQSPARMSLGASVARCLLRLWDFSSKKLSLDNPLLYDSVVDVFLCDGGKAGGEQGIFGRYKPANCIYIYHLETFTDAVEMAREVAHEYGHAVIPAIGGFGSPEEWGNGCLGERLFLWWLEAALRDKALTADDTLGASPAALRSWLARRANPLADHIWRYSARARVLKEKGQAAMNEYIGLMLFLAEAFPASLPRAIKLAGGRDAVSALHGAIDAVNESAQWDIALPKRIKTDIWLPLRGKLKVKYGTMLSRKGDWAHIRPAGSRLKISRG